MCPGQARVLLNDGTQEETCQTESFASLALIHCTQDTSVAKHTTVSDCVEHETVRFKNETGSESSENEAEKLDRLQNEAYARIS